MSDNQVQNLYNFAVRSLVGSMVVMVLSLALNLGVYKYRIERVEQKSAQNEKDIKAMSESVIKLVVTVEGLIKNKQVNNERTK